MQINGTIPFNRNFKKRWILGNELQSKCHCWKNENFIIFICALFAIVVTIYIFNKKSCFVEEDST